MFSTISAQSSATISEVFFLDLGIVIEPSTGDEEYNRIVEAPSEEVNFQIKKAKSGSIYMAASKEMLASLDRINNRSNDNRIENLRFICPNCLSQIKKKTSIFQKMKRENIKECIDCGKQIKEGKTRYNKMECVKFRCKDCIGKKINLPMVYETSFSLSL